MLLIRLPPCAGELLIGRLGHDYKIIDGGMVERRPWGTTVNGVRKLLPSMFITFKVWG
jgi:hypothetical protein